jgi:hypothetical protein
MVTNNPVVEEQIQNELENSDDDEVDETGKTDDQSDVKAKKKRKKKKKNKGIINHFERNINLSTSNLIAQTTTTDDNLQTDQVPNGAEAIATLSVQQDGIYF